MSKHLFCDNKSHSKIKDLAKRIGISMSRLFSVIIKNVTLEKCIEWVDKDRRKK